MREEIAPGLLGSTRAEDEHWVWPIIAAVLAFTVLLTFTLHRIDRERRLGLAYVVLPLTLPLLIGLATATLVHDLYQDWFGELVYGLFSSESMDMYHGLLSPCSRMLGFDELSAVRYRRDQRAVAAGAGV